MNETTEMMHPQIATIEGSGVIMTTSTSTAARRIEHRIARKLLQRREGGFEQERITPWADRLIAVASATVGLLILGSYVEELLWAAVAAATVVTLR